MPLTPLVDGQPAPCPSCGAIGGLTVDVRLVPAPLTADGAAPDPTGAPGRGRPVLTCPACGLSLAGEWDTDGRHVLFDDPSRGVSGPPAT